ncbi:unnamed protein product, partial [Amoebophrya sp. A25]
NTLSISDTSSTVRHPKKEEVVECDNQGRSRTRSRSCFDQSNDPGPHRERNVLLAVLDEVFESSDGHLYDDTGWTWWTSTSPKSAATSKRPKRGRATKSSFKSYLFASAKKSRGFPFLRPTGPRGSSNDRHSTWQNARNSSTSANGAIP